MQHKLFEQIKRKKSIVQVYKMNSVRRKTNSFINAFLSWLFYCSIFTTLLFCIHSNVFAGSNPMPRCRTGIVLKTEKTEGQNIVGKFSGSAEYQSYILITIQPDQGRSLSKFDYVLDIDGKEFACLAISKNEHGSFNENNYELKNDSGNNVFVMLFPDINGKTIKNAELKFKLLDTGITRTKLNFDENKQQPIALVPISVPVQNTETPVTNIVQNRESDANK